MAEIVGIRFRRAGRVYYFDPAGLELKVNDDVIVKTSRGMELGRVAIAPKQVLAEEVTEPLVPVVRKAAPEGLEIVIDDAIDAETDAIPSESYRLRYVGKRLRNANAVLAVLTRSYAESDPCWLEMSTALAMGKIVPISLDPGLSPAGIDLNFGCPAKTVNRHGGGAMLLATPEVLFRVASAVRGVLPTPIPFTATLRLGVSDTGRALECAGALEAGGVEALVVHARTKLDGYRPPAHWEWVARIRAAVGIPVAANGEVWTVDDYLRCRSVGGISAVMLGRGAVADPFLARRIRASIGLLKTA